MTNLIKKKIVISAVNLTEGGGREVLLSVLRAISLDRRFRAIAIVNNKSKTDLIRSTNIKYLQVPKTKKSWVNRLFFEYVFSMPISKRLNADIWLSLHDITPNVVTNKRYVYCHNIAPFYNFNFSDVKLDFKFSLFVLFYKWIYRININNNNAVFVQQSWIADKFVDFFNFNNCIVALPEEDKKLIEMQNPIINKKNINSEVVFFYPTLPRTYKNLEIIFESVNLLNKKNIKGYKVIITVKQGENKYIDYLINKYGKPNEIDLCGRLKKSQMNEYYNKCDFLLFPSKLETWGLPIREAISYNLPLLLADHQYSRSTSYGYDKVCFFNMSSARELSMIMSNVISKNDSEVFKNNSIVPDCQKKYKELASWKKLLDYVFAN